MVVHLGRVLFLVSGFVLLTFGVFIPINYMETSAIADGIRERRKGDLIELDGILYV